MKNEKIYASRKEFQEFGVLLMSIGAVKKVQNKCIRKFALSYFKMHLEMMHKSPSLFLRLTTVKRSGWT